MNLKATFNKYFGQILLILCLVIQLTQIIYFKRAVFLNNYDPEYWQDRLEHSQWTLPLSRRDIGDDGIYSYGGYQLIKGASIENTYTNKPPVGIYLIGLSISIFHNPLYFALITGLFSLLIFYLLIKQFLKTELSLFATLLLSFNPLFIVHSTIVLLDLIQAFLLLLNVYFFTLINKSKKFQIWLILSAGIILGLFTETKPPIYTPIILFLEVIYLIFQKRIRCLIVFVSGFGIGVITPYFRYFQTGHNIFDFLKLHKYMVSVYAQNYNTVHHFALIQALITGKFPDISSGGLTIFSEWWPILPLIVIFGLIAALRELMIKSTYLLKAMAIFTIFVLVINCLIPSYPRYVIIILPFLIFFYVSLFEKLPKKFVYIPIFIICVYGFRNTYQFLIPDPQPTLDRFYYNFSLQFFQDIYQENLANPKNVAVNRSDFRELTQGVYNQGQIKQVKLTEISQNIDQQNNNGQVKVLATYFTQELGSFSEDKTIELIKVNNEWKIVWDWDLLINGFQPGDSLQTKVEYGTRGKIIDKNKHILAEDTTGYLISINPNQIDPNKEISLINLLEPITGIGKDLIYDCYHENPLPNQTVAIATNIITLKPAVLEKLKSFSGVTLTSHATRVYDFPELFNPLNIKNGIYNEFCTHIYNSTTYHGTLDAEARFDSQLRGQNGGTLVLVDNNNNNKIIRILINQKVINGNDILN